MSSIDISQIPTLVANDGYPFLFQEYTAQPVLYPELCEVMPTDFGMLGDKGRVASGVGNMKKVLDGQPIPADTGTVVVGDVGKQMDVGGAQSVNRDSSTTGSGGDGCLQCVDVDTVRNTLFVRLSKPQFAGA